MRSTCLLSAVLSLTVAIARAQPDASVLNAEAQRIAVINKVKDCVLSVFAPNGQGGGSGVVVTHDGYALSNFHVVVPCGKALQCGMANGEIYDAVLVGVDPTGDVALVKLFGRDAFPCATLGDSDRVRAGDWVLAMGNPFLLAADLQPTVTYGIVSGVHRYQFPAGTLLEYADCLQIDASINPGNSGGPLFDAEGKLIGINGRALFEKRGRVNVGAAYAVSINQIKNFLGALRGGLIVDHATLGARIADDEDGRAVVSDILDNSDAYRRGLRYDDEIVSFGGRPISTPNGFKNALGIYPKGWRVPLSFRRDGKRHDILVRLTGVHNQEELLEALIARPTQGPMPLPKPNEPKPGEGKPKAVQPPPIDRPVPEVVKSHFIAKRGYSNYYFNTLHQERVWRAWISAEGLGGATGPWTLTGRSQAGRPVQFVVDDAGVSMRLPSGETRWAAGSEPGSSLLPDGSGGLLPALYLWRRLAVEGLGRFGEVYYDGTAPLAEHAGLCDVLVGFHRGLQCRFYFDATEGRLLALEMSRDEESDPCEVYFSEYRPAQGRSVPGRVEVRFGDEVFAIFTVSDFRARTGN